MAREIAATVSRVPEVRAIAAFVGVPSPIDFNGMVRHYYLRSRPWQGEIQVQLTDKGERSRTSHEIALQARAELTPMARDMGALMTAIVMSGRRSFTISTALRTFSDSGCRADPKFENEIIAGLRRKGVAAVASHPHLDTSDGVLQQDIDQLSGAVGADGILMSHVVSVDTRVEAAEGREAIKSTCRGGDLVELPGRVGGHVDVELERVASLLHADVREEVVVGREREHGDPIDVGDVLAAVDRGEHAGLCDGSRCAV